MALGSGHMPTEWMFSKLQFLPLSLYSSSVSQCNSSFHKYHAIFVVCCTDNETMHLNTIYITPITSFLMFARFIFAVKRMCIQRPKQNPHATKHQVRNT